MLSRARVLIERGIALWCVAWMTLVIVGMLLSVVVCVVPILLVVGPYKWLTGKSSIEGFGARIAI